MYKLQEKNVKKMCFEIYNNFLSFYLESESPFWIANSLLFNAAWTKTFENFNPGYPNFIKLNGDKVNKSMLKRISKDQVVATFNTTLVAGRSQKCITVAIPYQVIPYFKILVQHP